MEDTGADPPHTPADQVDSISGPVLSLGPTRLLKNSENNLLARLGLSTTPTTGQSGLLLVLLAELLLCCGAAGRMLSFQMNDQLDRLDLKMDLLWDLLKGENVEEINRLDLSLLHMMTATLGHMILIPQLYILVVYAEEKLTLMLQLVLALLVVVLALGMHALDVKLENQAKPENVTQEAEDDHQDRGLGLHKAWGWILAINIIIFLTITFIRVLFNLRLKNWIINIKCIGPIINFLVSRRSREFQSLVLIIVLSVTVLSGMILNTNLLYSDKSEEMIQSKTSALLVDLMSALVCLLGLMVLFMIYLYSHTSYSHTRVVGEHRLEQELVMLGERHKQVLVRDNAISKTKYCPVTRSARPGDSGQLLGPGV